MEFESNRTSHHTQRLGRATNTVKTLTATTISDDALRHDLQQVLPLLGIGDKPPLPANMSPTPNRKSSIARPPETVRKASFSSPRKAGLLR